MRGKLFKLSSRQRTLFSVILWHSFESAVLPSISKPWVKAQLFLSSPFGYFFVSLRVVIGGRMELIDLPRIELPTIFTLVLSVSRFHLERIDSWEEWRLAFLRDKDPLVLRCNSFNAVSLLTSHFSSVSVREVALLRVAADHVERVCCLLNLRCKSNSFSLLNALSSFDLAFSKRKDFFCNSAFSPAFLASKYFAQVFDNASSGR